MDRQEEIKHRIQSCYAQLMTSSCNPAQVGVSSLLTANMLPAGCSGSAVLTRLTRRCSCHGVEFKPKLYISSAQGSE